MPLRRLLAMAGLLLAASLPAAASEFNVVYQFTGKSDGAYPESLAAGPGGTLFGILSDSRIFRLDPPALGSQRWTETVIYTQPAYDPITGAYFTLSGGLIVDALGDVYAAAGAYGNAAPSSIFELSPPSQGHATWTKTVLNTDFQVKGVGSGSNPRLSYRDSSGVLFGTFDIRQGGVFRLAPDTKSPGKWNFELLTFFDQFHGDPNDGLHPSDLIPTPGGSFLGVTDQSDGSIFRLTPPAPGQTKWTRQTVLDFDPHRLGFGPGPIIADRAGTVFGNLAGGSLAHSGSTSVVYKLTSPHPGAAIGTSTVLQTFGTGAPAGSFPPTATGRLVEDSHGVLYGTTQSAFYGAAQLFKLTPRGASAIPWNLTYLHDFAGPGDGIGLQGLVRTMLPDGRLAMFGAAFTGGISNQCVGGELNGCGTIYEYIP